MAAIYTQDEFLKAVEGSGLRGQWSDADWNHALQDPDWGMSILSGKIRWNNATTDEERAAANQWNEENRRMKGYSGGSDGSLYHILPTPASFKHEEAPSFQSSASGDRAELWDKQVNYADYVAPEYVSRHRDNLDRLENQVANTQPFSYDAATDPLYSQYRKQYIREGRRAAEDTMGLAAAMTGGLPSSYAATAAAQQGNYYASQLTDKIPELYQLAYNQYVSDNQIARSNLSAIQALEQADRAQFNTDRDFDYGVYGDKYNRIANDLQTARSMEDTDWSRYLDRYNIYNTNRNFAYDQYMDELAAQQQEKQDKWDQAATAAEQGDFSLLDKLGVDTSRNPYDYAREQDALDRQRQAELDALDKAELGAGYGDYGGLNSVGITPNMANVNDQGLAARGEYTGNGGLSEEQVMQLQYYLGITMDGWYGPESMAATGGMTAAQAYQAMLDGTLPRGGVGGGYSGGGDYGYAEYLPEPETDNWDYGTPGAVPGDGSDVTGSPYIPGAGNDKPSPVQPTGDNTRTGNKTTDPSTGKNTATTGEMLQLTMDITAKQASGATSSQIKSYIDEAYDAGVIDANQRDSLRAGVKNTKNSGSKSTK